MIEPNQNTDAQLNERERKFQYFSVSPLKFMLMWLATLGLYSLYWQYKNWKIIQKELSLDIMPFWRAFFSPLWFFSLLKYIHASAEEKGIYPTISPMLLAVAYFILSALWRLPDPYWLASYLAAAPILVANSTAESSNSLNPLFKSDSKLKLWQWPAVILGASILFIFLYAFAGDESIEEFTFKFTLQRDLISKCDGETECTESVKLQIKPCMDQSNWRHFLDHQDDKEEIQRFVSEFYSCMVDSQGNPIFKTN